VTFGGQTQFKPGGLTRVNANALTPVGISATGIVQLLGEADGGPPGTAGIVVVDDPALARDIFTSGPLADAVRVAFDPSGDTRIPGGAFRALAYKTNASLQSSISLPGDEAEVSDTSTAASTTTIVTVTTGGLVVDAHIGRWCQHGAAAGSPRRRITDNDATTITVTPAFDVAPQNLEVILILEDQLTVTSTDYGLHTNRVSVEFEAGTGVTFVVTLAFDDDIVQSDEICGDPFIYLKYVGGAIFNLTGTITAIDATGLIVTTDLTAAGLDDAAGMTLQMADGSQRQIASNTIGANSVYTLSAGHALTTAQQTALLTTAVSVRNVTTATASITWYHNVA
jgi:hypothetical protein